MGKHRWSSCSCLRGSVRSARRIANPDRTCFGRPFHTPTVDHRMAARQLEVSVVSIGADDNQRVPLKHGRGHSDFCSQRNAAISNPSRRHPHPGQASSPHRSGLRGIMTRPDARPSATRAAPDGTVRSARRASSGHRARPIPHRDADDERGVRRCTVQ